MDNDLIIMCHKCGTQDLVKNYYKPEKKFVYTTRCIKCGEKAKTKLSVDTSSLLFSINCDSCGYNDGVNTSDETLINNLISQFEAILRREK